MNNVKEEIFYYDCTEKEAKRAEKVNFVVVAVLRLKSEAIMFEANTLEQASKASQASKRRCGRHGAPPSSAGAERSG